MVDVVSSSESGKPRKLGPLRSFSRFFLALLYFFLARLLAQHGAQGLVAGDWQPLVEQTMLAFLLLIGYLGFGSLLDRQPEPVAQQGLPLRKGWTRELALGLALGWMIALVCVLLMAVFCGISLHFSVSLATLGWLLVEIAYFAMATLTIQLAFRGYPFQRAIGFLGEWPASLMFAVFYATLLAWLPGSGRSSIAVHVALSLLLALAYLRTRALWLPWGLHFGWVASRALLFGLPVNGVSSHSPVVQGIPVGYSALAGSDFGLDGSWMACTVILFAMPFVYRATRELSFQYNAPVIEPAGIPVDLDAAAKRQHESATRPEQPEIKPLVQILPVAAPVRSAMAPDEENPTS